MDVAGRTSYKDSYLIGYVLKKGQVCSRYSHQCICIKRYMNVKDAKEYQNRRMGRFVVSFFLGKSIIHLEMASFPLRHSESQFICNNYKVNFI